MRSVGMYLACRYVCCAYGYRVESIAFYTGPLLGRRSRYLFCNDCIDDNSTLEERPHLMVGGLSFRGGVSNTGKTSQHKGVLDIERRSGGLLLLYLFIFGGRLIDCYTLWIYADFRPPPDDTVLSFLWIDWKSKTIAP